MAELNVEDFGVAVFVDGNRVADRWAGDDVVALADLSIAWGRDKLLDKPRAGVLKLSLIDPTGTWPSSLDLDGASIRVFLTQKPGTPDEFLSRLNFDGRTSGYDMTAAMITNPKTNEPARVWRIDLTAGDAIADLGQAQIAGPDNGGAWASKYQNARLNDIQNRAPGLVTAILSSGDDTPSMGNYLVRAHTASDGLSLLRLLELCWAHIPGAWVNVNPGGTVEIGKPAKGAGIALALEGGQIVLDYLGAWMIDAGLIETGGAVSLASSVQEAIDQVQVTHYDAAGNALTSIRNTARYRGGASGIRVWKIDTDILNAAAVANDLLTGAVAIADRLNGQLHRRAVTIDLTGRGDRLPYDGEFYRQFMEPKTRPDTVFFPRSLANPIPNAPHEWQVIGGTLTFRAPKRAGWAHTMNLAPAPPTAQPVTLGELVTNPGPTLGDFHPSITLADLGLVTQGLS